VSGFRPRFFISPGPLDGRPEVYGALAGATVTLDAEDSHHALRVLRLRPGDECEVVVGAAVYAATVQPVSGKTVQLLLGERLEGAAAGASYEKVVALVQAVPRPSALDWAIEKSTEAGVSLILLVQTAGSPRSAGKDAGGRQARWDRIAREAAKQSKQLAVPPVEAPVTISAALERVRTLGLLPMLMDPEAGQTLYDLLAAPAAGGPSGGMGSTAATDGGFAGVALWIGPESGWTAAERDALVQAGVATARLGRGVFRTETAGPVAVAVARLALGDW
jgi:16S rRNA (uracil1498-N3)-methyltransferase